MNARRRTVTALLLPWLAPAALAQAAPAPVAVTAIGVTVADLPTSVRFYTEVLGFRVVLQREDEGDAAERQQAVFGLHTQTARLQLGDEFLELTEFLAPRGRAVPADSRSNDRWFQHIAIVVSDMDAAYAELRRHRVRHASPSPQTLPAWNPDAAGIRAFYFQDPDGHPLEVLWFPAGKGAAKWHTAAPDRLFLGIDHTAIAVADTEQSLRFWRDGLSLRVVGSSDNHGIEQERLNNVFGAHLRITTLRGDRGPGVELLEYLTPRGGRPMPADTAACDLWQWTVHVDAAVAPARFRDGGGDVISVAAADGMPAAGALLVRDPDGHRALVANSAAAR